MRPDRLSRSTLDILPGDVISTVNQQPTSTPEQFASSLEMQRSAGQNALLLLDCRGEAIVSSEGMVAALHATCRVTGTSGRLPRLRSAGQHAIRARCGETGERASPGVRDLVCHRSGAPGNADAAVGCFNCIRGGSEALT